MTDGAGTEPGAPELTELRRSSRDPELLRQRLEAWLTTRLPADAAPTIPGMHATTATGMSSDTVLFTARRHDGSETRDEELVARIAPDHADVPVFPSYDLERQFRVIREVGERSAVPVPRVYWYEPDPAAIGSRFFVMERIDGDVPPDVMPYNFGDSWLFDAAAGDQRRLQDNSVAILAELHDIGAATDHFPYLEFAESGATPLRRHVAHARAWYEFAAAAGTRSPLVERGFAWLDEHWPAHEPTAVVSWGDSRIGNIMYRDFTPVAVFDWEMAGLGPREVDLGWMIYSHRAFEDIAANYGLAGMPHFMRRDDAATTYESRTGYTPRDLDFYLTYAGVQWGIVGLRTGFRSVHFAEREMPDDVDDLLLNRQPLEDLLAGTYWDKR